MRYIIKVFIVFNEIKVLFPILIDKEQLTLEAHFLKLEGHLFFALQKNKCREKVWKRVMGFRRRPAGYGGTSWYRGKEPFLKRVFPSSPSPVINLYLEQTKIKSEGLL